MSALHYPDFLSTHFSFNEAIASETAARNNIQNLPDMSVLAVMITAAQKMENVRDYLATPIHVNSWFRSLSLNRELKSKDTSQHIKGEAIDFISPAYGSPSLIAKRLAAAKEIIGFDQLILEHDWVHISFAILNGKPRYQVLSLLQNGSYSVGLTDKMGKALV